jgi:hypothetical protein
MKKSDRCILIDADVISHFITAGEMIALPGIFPYQIYVLDKVYREIERFPKRKIEVENLLKFGLIKEMPFPEHDDAIKKEYAHIKKWMFMGDGEAACLAVANASKNILASSNLKDVSRYCQMHSIDLLTTMDFVCEALRKNIFDLARCNIFINKVLTAGSKLPVSKMQDYNCQKPVFIIE